MLKEGFRSLYLAYGNLILFDTPFAVAGISCIRPIAPAWLVADLLNKLSWRMSARMSACSSSWLLYAKGIFTKGNRSVFKI